MKIDFDTEAECKEVAELLDILLDYALKNADDEIVDRINSITLQTKEQKNV